MDPSGQEANAYLYAGGNPVNFIDPTGLFSIQDAFGAVVGIGTGGLVFAATGNVLLVEIAGACAAAGTTAILNQEEAFEAIKDCLFAGAGAAAFKGPQGSSSYPSLYCLRR